MQTVHLIIFCIIGAFKKCHLIELDQGFLIHPLLFFPKFNLHVLFCFFPYCYLWPLHAWWFVCVCLFNLSPDDPLWYDDGIRCQHLLGWSQFVSISSLFTNNNFCWVNCLALCCFGRTLWFPFRKKTVLGEKFDHKAAKKKNIT